MGNTIDFDEIAKVWKPRIKLLMAQYAFGANDKDLLENELLGKLWKACGRYDKNKNASFDTFVRKVLINHIRTFLRSQQRKKQFNSALSLEDSHTGAPRINSDIMMSGDQNMRISDTLVDGSASVSIDNVILKVHIDRIRSYLPDICKDIFDLYIGGYTFKDISEMLGEDTALIKGMWQHVIKPLFCEELQ